MKIVCGVDIGNSTTEVTVANIDTKTKEIKFLISEAVKTTGVKGTKDNVIGIKVALSNALKNAGLNMNQVHLIKINEASPVIGESAMETIAETIITDSAMIGHNPDTPGGHGIAFGETIKFEDLTSENRNQNYIVVIPDKFNYEICAKKINNMVDKGISIKGIILKEDEGVLLKNRVKINIPIVDEVTEIEKVPIGKLAALEVADMGKTLKILSNPYGIANIFNLNSEETRKIIPIAKGLIGLRSGVVVRTPRGEVKERKIKAGVLKIIGSKSVEEADVNNGAEFIMRKVSEIEEINDIEGESSTNISAMIKSIKSSMAELSEIDMEKVKIKDILAIDTTIPLEIKGGIAKETYKEKAVAIAAMVKTHKLPLISIKKQLEKELLVNVEINGVEGVMATLGALTTKGTKLPIAIVDMGGGSTDVAMLDNSGEVKTVHLAGAGELVTMLINLELGLNDRNLAEEIKKNIVGKVESLYTLRLEDGSVKFFDAPLNSKLFGRIVVVREEELIPIYIRTSIEEIVKVRRKAKSDVFIKNILRGLKQISPVGNIHFIPNVVLVGGSALDFEVPDMVVKELSNYGIVSGSGNIRGCAGPRHAVSTGLTLHYIERL